MLIEIKHRINGNVLFAHDCNDNTILKTVNFAIKEKISLSDANLSDANLSGADLSCADLLGANLSDANLPGANLSCANLSDANLSNANLSGANLSCADLSYANLFGANLFGALGNMKEISSMQIELYKIAFTSEMLQIGCKTFSHNEWMNFNDEKIKEMDRYALKFWKKYKDFIFKAIELKFCKVY